MDETQYDMWNKFHWLKKIDAEAKNMETIGNRVKESLDMLFVNNNLSRYPLRQMNLEEEEKFYEQLEKVKKDLSSTLKEICKLCFSSCLFKSSSTAILIVNFFNKIFSSNFLMFI